VTTTYEDPAPDGRSDAAAARFAPDAPPAGMVRVPGGTFLMGSDDFYPEERPAHRVFVDEFLMDAHPVTVAAFARFATATSYVTVAERPPNPSDYSGVEPSLLVPGSLVFRAPAHRVSLCDPRRWWA
jgi:sulfatase modifying factor 1